MSVQDRKDASQKEYQDKMYSEPKIDIQLATKVRTHEEMKKENCRMRRFTVYIFSTR